MRHLIVPKNLRRRIGFLIKSPIFLFITVFGNLLIALGALVFHHVEYGLNPQVHDRLDSLMWAVGMVTTVGGGSIAPVTPTGKVLAILMMMGGAVFLWTYMAVFVGALVEPDLQKIQKEVSDIQHELR